MEEVAAVDDDEKTLIRHPSIRALSPFLIASRSFASLSLTYRLFCSHGVQCDTAAGSRGTRGGRTARRRARKRHAPGVFFRVWSAGHRCFWFHFFCFLLSSEAQQLAFTSRSFAFRSFVSSSHVRQGAPAQGKSELVSHE